MDPTTGTLVYLLGNDLWVAPLDGTSPPRAITSGAFGAGYAGYVPLPDGEIDLYYVSQLSEGRVIDNGFVADFALYHLGLGEGDPSEVARFVNKPLEPVLPTHGAVSPDGRYALYGDTAGLTLVDLRTGRPQPALANEPCQEKCTAYMFPVWSSRIDRVKVTKVLYEGSRELIVNPLTSPATIIDTEHGGLLSDLSPDGERLCQSEFGYGLSGRMLVLDISTREFHDAAANLALPTPLSPDVPPIDNRGCSWAADGRLAFGHATLGEAPISRITVVDTELVQLATSDVIEQLADVAAWLPDGSGVFFNRGSDQTGRQLPPALYAPGPGLYGLPFRADRVLGVIP
jgi:hypothetical protein